jgi:hypothetical protein
VFYGSKKMKQFFHAACVLLLFALPFAASPQSIAAPGHNSADGATPVSICRSVEMDMDASPVAAAAPQLLKMQMPSPLSPQNRHGLRSSMDAIAAASADLSAIPFRRVLQCAQDHLHNELFGVIFNCRAPPAFSAPF